MCENNPVKKKQKGWRANAPPPPPEKNNITACIRALLQAL